jgi:hypothetical protein
MKNWIPVAVVLIAALFLWNVVPRFVAWVLIFILAALLINRWGALESYFK